MHQYMESFIFVYTINEHSFSKMDPRIIESRSTFRGLMNEYIMHRWYSEAFHLHGTNHIVDSALIIDDIYPRRAYRSLYCMMH